jgi:hypothetical protein
MEVADNVIPSSNSEMAKIYSFRGSLIMLIIHRNQTNADQRAARCLIILSIIQLGTFRNAFHKATL